MPSLTIETEDTKQSALLSVSVAEIDDSKKIEKVLAAINALLDHHGNCWLKEDHNLPLSAPWLATYFLQNGKMLHLKRLMLDETAFTRSKKPIDENFLIANFPALKAAITASTIEDMPVGLRKDYAAFLFGLGVSIVFAMNAALLFFLLHRTLSFGNCNGVCDCDSLLHGEREDCNYYSDPVFTKICNEIENDFCQPGSFSHAHWQPTPLAWNMPSSTLVSCSTDNQYGFGIPGLVVNIPLLVINIFANIFRLIEPITATPVPAPKIVQRNWQEVQAFFGRDTFTGDHLLETAKQVVKEILRQYPEWVNQEITLLRYPRLPKNMNDTFYLKQLHLKQDHPRDSDGNPILDIVRDYTKLNSAFKTPNHNHLTKLDIRETIISVSPIILWNALWLLLFFFVPRTLKFCGFNPGGLKRCNGYNSFYDESSDCSRVCGPPALCQNESAYCPPGSFIHSAWVQTEEGFEYASCSLTNQVGFLIALALGAIPTVIVGIAAIHMLYNYMRAALCGNSNVAPIALRNNWASMQTFFETYDPSSTSTANAREPLSIPILPEDVNYTGISKR
ncbi:MAG: hypothetical protein A3E82_06340 [Gammaproteobacteria bacterium RIFCSPHIGHO2_12_FULL_38_11]|nr:MAG: hypothetical protein A3E82_06340 [Gammaproteobacteria bacterium RIFCSPHIGHO2_12_FULL_38_11]